jgi:hypothetical protein
MTHICPHCRKVCKSANGLKMHLEARHRGAGKPQPKLSSAPETLRKRGWIEPGLKSQPPALDEQIASMTLAFRLYELRQKEAVAEKNVTPHTAYHNCSNVLHALETLRWLRKNEAAIKAKLNGGAR